jgi:O-antigen/teichoic acid export membrane protein
MKDKTLPVWALFDQAVISATRFLIAVLVGKFGSESELGLYSAGFGLLVVIVTGQESLITTPYTFFVSQLEKPRQRSYAGSTLASALVYLAVATIALAAVVTVMWITGRRSGFPLILLAVVLILPVSLLREFCRRWLFAHFRIPMATIVDVVFSVTILGGLLVLTQINQVTAFNAFMVAGVGSLLAVLIAWQFRKEFTLDGSRWRSDLHKNFRFGRWTAGASLLSATLMYFSHWYLVGSQGEAAAGLYAACLTLVFLANPFLLGLSSFLAPRAAAEFAERGHAGVRRVVLGYMAVVVAVLVAFAGLLAVLGDWLIGIVFESHYRGHQFTINVLAAAMIGIGINFTLACGLRALVQPQQDWYASLIGLGCTAMLTLVLRPDTVGMMAVCFACGVFAMAVYRVVIFLYLARTPVAAAHEGSVDT